MEKHPNTENFNIGDEAEHEYGTHGIQEESDLLMYKTPEGDQLSEKDIERYITSTAKVNEKLEHDGSMEAEYDYIINGMNSENLDIRISSYKLLGKLPPEERIFYAKKGINNANQRIKRYSLLEINVLTKEEQLEYIDKILQSENEHMLVKWEALSLLKNQPIEIATEYINNELQKPTWWQCFEVPGLLTLLPKDEMLAAIKRGLEGQYFESKLYAIDLISNLDPSDQIYYITDILEGDDENKEVLCKALNYLNILTKDEQLKYIRKHIKNINSKVRSTIYNNARKNNIKLPEELQEGYEDEVKELTSIASKTPLYDKAPNNFFRHNFEKTGSGTTLLMNTPGNEEATLKEKVIIRTINKGSYLAWREAFESSSVWKTMGFDYVPIEPIVGATVHDETSTDVSIFTRVLRGPSFSEWNSKTVIYENEIKAQIEKILEGMNVLDITHGHTHKGNFVCVFEKNQDGVADISKPPKVYLIDFDQAYIRG